MKNELKKSIVSGLLFGSLMGIFFWFAYGPEFAKTSGPLAGIIFGSFMYFFTTSKIVKKQTAVNASKGQKLIYSDWANHKKKIEAAGGKLYLFSDKIHFKSHKFNFQNLELELPITQIQTVSFFNSLGFIPNGIQITLSNGTPNRFIVDNRNKWKEKIESQIATQ